MVVEIKYLAQVDKDKCIGCGSCENVCPTMAMNLVPLESPGEERVTPCRLACPAGIDIQGYIAHINRGEFSEALKLIKERNPFPLSVGRVCPHFCEEACRRNLVDQPIAINPLKRFVADYDQFNGVPFRPQVKPENGYQVAIIGGGPAGLSAAYYLRLQGYGVTIFETKPELGGMLRYGIPEYRLPKKILDQEIRGIQEMGVKIKTGVTFGEDINLKSLKADGYQAIFLATGLHLSRRLNIENEDVEGVLKGIDFLEAVALQYPVSLGKRVVVIGGGNVAVDVALTAIRKGAEGSLRFLSLKKEIEVALTAIRQGAEDVSLVCLERRDEMPAWKDEIQQAIEEGVKIINGLGPNRFIGKDGKLSAIEFKRCTSVFNEKGAFDPRYDATDLTILEADTAIVAIGQVADLSFLENDPELRKLILSKGGTIEANPRTLQSSIPNLFVGGDVLRGPQSVIQAIADGRTAASSIHQYLTFGSVHAVEIGKKELPEVDAWIFDYLPKMKRVNQPSLPLEERIHTFKEVEATISQAEAVEEASRCLSCGRKAVVTSEKCLACQNCRDICPVDAIAHVLRPVPLRLGVDSTEVDQDQIRELCLKAHLHPHQWLCLCSGVRVREGAAAVLKGAKTAEEIALMTGILSGCTIYCRMMCLRLLKAHGIEIKPPDKGYRWYGSTQTCWEVPEEVIEKYPGHFLKEDLDVFRKF